MTRKCIVCDNEDLFWPTADVTTGFSFDGDCYDMAKQELNDLLLKWQDLEDDQMQSWLRAIANARRKHKILKGRM